MSHTKNTKASPKSDGIITKDNLRDHMSEVPKRRTAAGMLVTALVFLENKNYTGAKKQIEMVLEHIDNKLPLK